jgi:hypothetical protein
VADAVGNIGAGEAAVRADHWRSTRVKLWPMPAELWDEATVLARELGVPAGLLAEEGRPAMAKVFATIRGPPEMHGE